MAILVDQWYLRMTRSRRKLATLGLAYCLDSCSSIVDCLAGSRGSPRRCALIPSESKQLLTAGSEFWIFCSKQLLLAELCCLPSTRDLLHRDPGPGLPIAGDARHGGVEDVEDGLPHVCWGPVGGVSFRRLAGEDDDDSSSSPNPSDLPKEYSFDISNFSSSFLSLPLYLLTMSMTLYPTPLSVLYPISPLKIYIPVALHFGSFRSSLILAL